MTGTRGLALAAVAAAFLATAAVGDAGTAVAGSDRARILPPAGAQVEPYANAGYRLSLHGGEARVTVDLTPLSSRAPFRPLKPAPDDPVARLAHAVTAGARSEYEAVSRILGWASRNLRYELDRGQPQEARSVLEERRGYCTGIARASVALLRAVGIPAREVAGYVADAGDGSPHGFHRWIEVRLADRGWVFSDPLTSHHYVDARYLRLAGERLDVAAGLDGLLVERADRRRPIDVYPAARSGVSGRRNEARQLAATLAVRLAGAGRGTAVLEGRGMRYRLALAGGVATFLGLRPGRYLLRLETGGRRPIVRAVELRDRVAADLYLPPSVPAAADRPAAALQTADLSEEAPR
ncbi:MAG: transglutaminase domain-containing protein [Acidobacteria bacterium]|nr:MAG: transglutaminase domain-containing protein [Acidobacteriota bacterium]